MYLSDASLVMYRKDYAKLEMMAMQDGALAEYLLCADPTISMGDGTVRINWTDMRWDSTVQDALFDMPEGTYWEFIRVGQDWDDMEVLNNIPQGEHYRLYVKRTIEAY